MDATKQRHQWSYEETSCFLALWSSSEVQSKLDGASRTKPVLQKIQREMAVAGFDRSLDQIGNKLKKLKMDYRVQKKDLGRSGNGRPRRNPHFDVLDAVLGDRPSCQVTGALNSATVMLESMVDDSLQQSCPDHERSAINVELPSPLGCSSPAPSSTSSGELSSERGKRKRDSISELVTYLERADERFLQHIKGMDDAMRLDTQCLLGLMGRMVAVMEAQVQNYEKRSSILMTSTETFMQEPSHLGCVSPSKRKVKDHNNRSGSDRRTNKWFDCLDALLGHKPAFSGAAVTKENAIASSPRPMSSAERHTRQGKRKRDSDFIDALRDIEVSNRTALHLGQEQCDKYMQLLLESHAEEREMRRQEFAFHHSQAEESRLQQRDLQAGFLSVLGQLAQSLKKTDLMPCSDLEHVVETTELSAPGVDDCCDEDVYLPIISQSSTTSALLLECEEEELEPCQKHTLLVHLKEEEA